MWMWIVLALLLVVGYWFVTRSSSPTRPVTLQPLVIRPNADAGRLAQAAVKVQPTLPIGAVRCLTSDMAMMLVDNGWLTMVGCRNKQLLVRQ
jgi:hypothetical protein